MHWTFPTDAPEHRERLIIDSQPLVAMVARDPDYELLEETIKGKNVGLGTTTYSHAAEELMDRYGRRGRQLLTEYIRKSAIEDIAFNIRHADAANWAYEKYGPGRHRAALNLKRCMTYAFATVAEEPLLHLGNGFEQTDVIPVQL